MTAVLPFPAKHTVMLKKACLQLYRKKVLRLFMQMEGKKNQKDEAEEHNILHF